MRTVCLVVVAAVVCACAKASTSPAGPELLQAAEARGYGGVHGGRFSGGYGSDGFRGRGGYTPYGGGYSPYGGGYVPYGGVYSPYGGGGA